MKSLLLPLSALLLLLAVLLTLQTALSAPAARERLDRRRADLRQLQAAANLRAPVLQRFRDLPADRDFPAALQALADQTLPPGTWTLEYAAPVSLAPFPASMTEATLRIADAPYADLARFLDLLPSAPLPIHLHSATFRPSSTPARGAATLLLRAL
ncbi:MAG: hypothetical protein IJT88_05990 [Kiritimatiellae bacterium]|nr:hypothetical protein [Kiritimatiellia bacterium]